jgi:hypothetical protein
MRKALLDMFSSVLSALVVSAAIASPVRIQTQDDPNSGLTWIFKDQSLPKLVYVELRCLT